MNTHTHPSLSLYVRVEKIKLFPIFSILAFLCFHPAAYGNDDDHESRGRHVVRVLRRREKLIELTEEAEKERGTMDNNLGFFHWSSVFRM